MINKITVCSKKKAEQLNLNDYKVLSILDPDDWANLDTAEKNVLRVNFDDCEEGEYDFVLFTEAQAKRIWDFVLDLNNDDKDYKLVCHCRAGLSRSVSTAIAIVEILNIDRSNVVWLKKNSYNLNFGWFEATESGEDDMLPLPDKAPNQFVYNTLVKAYECYPS